MRYWDSSALISLFVAEQLSVDRTLLFKQDGQIATWWASKVECASAFHRRHRERSLDQKRLAQALENLEVLSETWNEVLPSEDVRRRALRLMRIHPLTAADAFQLAAALVAAREDPTSLAFVASDEQLKNAAQKEGFAVL